MRTIVAEKAVNRYWGCHGRELLEYPFERETNMVQKWLLAPVRKPDGTEKILHER